MLHYTQAIANALNDNDLADLADLFAPLDEPEGYDEFALGAEIARAVHRIRRQRAAAYGVPVTNRSADVLIREMLNSALRPYGFCVRRLPTRRVA